MHETNYAKMLPFLDDDEIEELAEKISDSPTGELNGLKIQSLLPFIDDDDVVGKIYLKYLEKGRLDDAKKMLPFLDDDFIDQAVKEFIDGTIPNLDIKSMLPFMDDDTVEELAKKITANGGGSYNGISYDSLLPFLDEDVVGEEFAEALEEGRDISMFLPFVDDDYLTKAVDSYIAGNDNIDIDKIYPFLDDDDLKRLFKYEFYKKSQKKQ
jgi:hypothetical protein